MEIRMFVQSLNIASIAVAATLFGPVIAAHGQDTVRTGTALSCPTEETALQKAQMDALSDKAMLDAEIQIRLRRIEELEARVSALVPVVYETRCCQ